MGFAIPPSYRLHCAGEVYCPCLVHEGEGELELLQVETVVGENVELLVHVAAKGTVTAWR